jgi:hypothetical protein
MNLFLRYREQVYKLSYALGQELEQLLLTFTTAWRVEHADDGTHVARRSIQLTGGNGATYYLWVDATGDVRVGTTDPADNDLSGTVVGGQS